MAVFPAPQIYYITSYVYLLHTSQPSEVCISASRTSVVVTYRHLLPAIALIFSGESLR